MTYVPFTKRLSGDTSFAELREGFPAHLVQPMWILLGERMKDFRNSARNPSTAKLLTLQNKLQLDPPLNWNTGHYSAFRDVESRFGSDEDFALDFIDFVLHHHATESLAESVRSVFVEGGSMWGVDSSPEGHFQLIARQGGPVRDVIDSIAAPSEAAHKHLKDAWLQANAHHPDPSSAYSAAIKAVEAVSIPLVLPNDPQATLGKVIRQIRDNPSQWDIALEGLSIEDFARQCEVLWKGQTDRHAPARKEISRDDARASAFLSIYLVGMFVERLIKYR